MSDLFKARAAVLEYEAKTKMLQAQAQAEAAATAPLLERIAELERELAEASKDAERLDQMIFHSAKVCHSNDAEWCWVVWSDEDGSHETKMFGDARAAIDALTPPEQPK